VASRASGVNWLRRPAASMAVATRMKEAFSRARRRFTTLEQLVEEHRQGDVGIHQL